MKTKAIVLTGLLLTASIGINAAEEDEWLQSGSMQEKTDNWLKGAIGNETPPDDSTVPLKAPTVAGMIMFAVAGAMIMKKRNSKTQ
jgi:hypothetical protein